MNHIKQLCSNYDAVPLLHHDLGVLLNSLIQLCGTYFFMLYNVKGVLFQYHESYDIVWY